MAIQHEITRDLVIELMRQNKVSNVNTLTALYKEVYNVVEASTDSHKTAYGFKDEKH